MKHDRTSPIGMVVRHRITEILRTPEVRPNGVRGVEMRLDQPAIRELPPSFLDGKVLHAFGKPSCCGGTDNATRSATRVLTGTLHADLETGCGHVANAYAEREIIGMAQRPRNDDGSYKRLGERDGRPGPIVDRIGEGHLTSLKHRRQGLPSPEQDTQGHDHSHHNHLAQTGGTRGEDLLLRSRSYNGVHHIS